MGFDRQATTVWEGDIKSGSGTATLDTSNAAGPLTMSFPHRAGDAEGHTSPEELIAAAHATCFSMALSHALANAGTPPDTVDTQADVTFQPGKGITGIHLTVQATVPGVSADDFTKAAEDAKVNCPVSQALTGTTITLDASLV